MTFLERGNVLFSVGGGSERFIEPCFFYSHPVLKCMLNVKNISLLTQLFTMEGKESSLGEKMHDVIFLIVDEADTVAGRDDAHGFMSRRPEIVYKRLETDPPELGGVMQRLRKFQAFIVPLVLFFI